jgi:hypothetical protein
MFNIKCFAWLVDPLNDPDLVSDLQVDSGDDSGISTPGGVTVYFISI